jgi:hypothetical protein
MAIAGLTIKLISSYVPLNLALGLGYYMSLGMRNLTGKRWMYDHRFPHANIFSSGTTSRLLYARQCLSPYSNRTPP